MTSSMAPLGCDPVRIKGMSERLITSHCAKADDDVETFGGDPPGQRGSPRRQTPRPTW
jgi:hypothetical protein